ncbi:putative P-loop containing nucleoside triphosphate hydrolase, leucine-rich repeat domain superfamily [Helianthus annuus]|nr:putative P-loop containing nucleoside triphosphate hydrolase, leucine-rich repeat domain superfamily [Helianthus annuus]KAJ0953866.1 putative P-loop containing nucleoside triphosphate hydrolase, leucine-rich repeat domain superfamily [Helianthus annuus]
MAEIIVSELLKPVIEKLSSEALKKIERSQGIQSELKKLKRTQTHQIQALLTDASQKEITQEAVQNWLNGVQHLAYHVLNDLATEAKVKRLLVPTCCTNLSLSQRMHHKLDTITTKLQDLEKEKIGLGLVGMGGLGKTTLARLLYDDEQVKKHFELMAWVCVSDQFDIFNISKVILQYVKEVEKEEFADLNLLQVALNNQLKEKRFLMVLDDVWSESYEDWVTLVSPFHACAPGSKIIMTTRKVQLLKKLGRGHLNHMQILSHDVAVSLFSQHTFGTKITHLPENVSNLYNLQTLIVFGCECLSKFLINFSKLKNLRHLDIRDTPLLNKIPLGIGELKSLQTLSKIIIGGDNGLAITELKDLTNLHGKTRIKGLEKVEMAVHACEANFSQKRLSELELEWSVVFDDSRNESLEKEVLDVLKPHSDSLIKLGIVSYGGIEFPNWVGDTSFLSLLSVSLRGCKNCTSLPPLAQLASLKKLFIEDMDKVIPIGLELIGTGLAFSSLEILELRNMKRLEVWSTDIGVVIFPCLEKLLIENCPSLVEVSLYALPSLNILEVSECDSGVLRRLVQGASSVMEFKI